MFEKLLAQIASHLVVKNLPYMVIGGQAVLLYGEPRLTRDIDITLGTDPSRLSEVLQVAKELELKVLPESVEDFVKQTLVLPVLEESTGIRVDFIFSFSPYEAQAIERAKIITVAGQSVSFAAPEDVIIHKVFSRRPRDLEDVKSILLKHRELNKNYIQKWLKEFDGFSDEKQFAATFEGLLKSVT